MALARVICREEVGRSSVLSLVRFPGIEGPSHFSGARGMPVSLAAWSIASKHLAQSLDPAEPSVKKKRRKKVV